MGKSIEFTPQALAKRLKDERDLAFSLAVGAALMYGMDKGRMMGTLMRQHGGEIAEDIQQAQRDYEKHVQEHGDWQEDR